MCRLDGRFGPLGVLSATRYATWLRVLAAGVTVGGVVHDIGKVSLDGVLPLGVVLVAGADPLVAAPQKTLVSALNGTVSSPSGWRYTVVISARRLAVWQRLPISFEHGEAGHRCFAWKATPAARYCVGDVEGESGAVS